MQPATDAIVLKSRFAAIANVTPQCVTKWIDNRTIDGDALVGEGRSAKIRVDVALSQIGQRRDPSRAMGPGLKTRLTRPAPGVAATPGVKSAPSVKLASVKSGPATSPDPASAEPVSIEERIRVAKLEEIERRNRRQREDEVAREGHYVEAAAARREMGKLAGEMMRLFEGALPEIATDLASEFKLEQRDVLHLMRERLRKVRAAVADKVAARIETTPERQTALIDG